MCGIAGFYNPEGTGRGSTSVLLRMLSRIRYRGPDECGIYLGPRIGMGNVRLSIIDLESGQQPIPGRSGNCWIVFNGEIFNYIELREQLKKKGHVFRTSSDTEVVVRLYEEYGPDCLGMLNGQFAIAIWNKAKNELFLARDRMGIRPLFYTSKDKTFIFGSEIKTFLEYPGFHMDFSMQSLSQVFTFWTTLSPSTAFRDIYELPPGHFMVVNQEGIEVKQYWSLTFPPREEESQLSFEEAKENFSDLFSDAVRIRLRADVPVGAYLSGGIDSSITTAYIKKLFPESLRTFSIGFTEKEFDESMYQNLAVDYLKTDHTSIICNPADIAQSFPKVVYHSEIPLIRTAPVPMFLLSESVHKNDFKVVITGEGADEMLAGYNIFKEMAVRRFWAREPSSKYRPLLLQKLYPYLPQIQASKGNMLRFFFGYKLEETASPLYSHLLRWNNTSRIRNFFTDDLRNSLSGYDPLEELLSSLPEGFTETSHLSQAQWLETSIFMSGYLLSSQGDRMAMANSVEGRYPFLDHRLMEFCSGLPAAYKLRGLNEKYMLKKLMLGKLPEEILNRPKQAYRAPIRSTFTDDPPEYVREILSGSALSRSGLFEQEKVGRLLVKMESGAGISEIDNMALTGIISTQLLYSQFLDGGTHTPETIKENECKIIQE